MMVFFTVMAMSFYVYSIDYLRYREREEGKMDTRVLDISCTPGECVTNVQTGIKRCPADVKPELYDAATGTCNPRYKCTAIRTLHPVGPNGNTLVGTDCPPGISCNCSPYPRCSLDRATVLLLNEGVVGARVLLVRNDGSKINIPPGYRLTCEIPHDLAPQVFRCDMSTLRKRFDCISGIRAREACPDGTAAASIPRIGRPPTAPRFYCIHADPCSSNEVLHYDHLSRRSMCLKYDQGGTTI